MPKTNSLKRIFDYLKPYRVGFGIALFLTIATIVIGQANSYISGLPTTKIAQNLAAKESVDFDYIKKVCFLLAGFAVLQFITKFIAGVLVARVVQNSMRDLRTTVQEKMNRLPVAYFDKHAQGDVLSRVTNDVDALSNAIQQSFISIITAIVTLIVAFAMMVAISPILALIALIGVPLAFAFSKMMIKRSQPYFKGQQNQLGKLNGFVQENLTGFSVLKLYGREQETADEFEKINDTLRGYGRRAAFMSQVMNPIVTFISYYAIYIIITLVGAHLIFQGSLQVGELQSMVYYIYSFSQPISTLTQLSAVIQSASAASSRLFEFLDEPEEEVLMDFAHLPEKVEGAIEFRHAAFQYLPDKPLITDLNISIPAGATVAIVGPTGAGKTTMINLLERFYDLTGGQLLLDGVDVATVPRSEVRRVFGMVLQDAWLYHATIRENIRFGRLDATDDDVVQAAKIANVDHFIRTLPHGYDTVIDAEGDNISQGQKQLVTIARAIIANPKILILDEATSSIDTRMERLIQAAMNNVMEGRTSFVIAHRLSTIRDADLILVMNHGNIVEHGNHEQLLATGGVYANLYNSQFGDFDE
jgi:ATP-binding cassette subfamily B multidrug efflux pump